MVSKPGNIGGGLIRRARLRGGLSQRELAKRLGTSQSLVARWERGRVSPSIETVIKAIRACGFDLEMAISAYDLEHDAHISQNLKLSPADRLRQMLQGTEALQRLKDKAQNRGG